MCFKRTLALMSLVLVTACGLNVGEKPPPAMDLHPSTTKYACVGEIAKKTELYINAQMSDQEINTFISCLQGAFFAFSQYMHGQQDFDSFTPDEIRKFIQDNLLPQDAGKITDELLRQFMLIKQNLVGGDLDRIKRSDLEAANQILEQIRVEAIRMRPYMRILNPKLVDHEDKTLLGENIAKAEQAARMTSQAFGKIMSTSQKPYSFKDLESFISEFRKFAKWQEHFPDANSAKAWTDLISSFKSIAVSKSDKYIEPRDWIPLFQYSAEWYLNYIKFDVVLKKQPVLLEGRGLQNLIGWSDSMLDLLKEAVRNQNDQMISFEAVDRFLYALKGMKWLPDHIRVSSLSSALRATTNRILGPHEEAANVRSAPGITKVTVANLAVELAQWQEIQLYLYERFAVSENRKQKIKKLEETIPALNAATEISTDVAHGREAWDRLIEVFKGAGAKDSDRATAAIFLEGSDRVHLSDVSGVGSYETFFNLSRMNIYRLVMSLVFKGYADAGPHGVVDAQLSQAQLQSFYQDFREIGIDLGMTDRRTETAGKRTFLEAKLFTYLADGISPDRSNLTFTQAMEEAMFLYSGGQLSQDLYERKEGDVTVGGLIKDCGKGPKDIYGHPKIRRSCVRRNIVDELLTNVTTMPSYTKFLQSLDNDGRMLYADTLMRAAFNKKNLKDEPNGVDYVELSELATMAMVVHYSEAVMTRYNTERPEDGILSETEVNNALSVFRDLALSTMTPPRLFRCWQDAKKALAENGFKFVIRYGYMPESDSDFWTVLWYASEANPNWDLHVTRQDLTQVFATLIQKISDGKQQEPPDCRWFK